MDLVERAIFLAIGGGIGFILGYIVARLRDIEKEVHEVLDIEKQKNGDTPRRIRDEEGAVRLSFSRIALFIVVVLVAYSAFMSQKASNDVTDNFEEDKISRCQAGVDNRNVQRELVEAVYNLATGSAQRDPEAPPLTAEEVKQYNAYIDRVNDFRSTMYKKIKPSEECAPFVDDNNVDPPSDPFPNVPTPKEKPNE
jgi:Flp pilus assembly pilin Flp